MSALAMVAGEMKPILQKIGEVARESREKVKEQASEAKSTLEDKYEEIH